jgi:ankyrin repeat protein
MATRGLHTRFTLRMFIPAAVALALCAATGPVYAAPPKRPKARQNAQADRLMPDLYAAAMRGDPDGVKALLARGAQPDARNFLGMTPLMMTAAAGKVEMAELLLNRGAKLEAASTFGTALTFAAMTGNGPVARFLLGKGADVNAGRPDKISVLMLAARSGSTGLVELILDRKAHVDTRDISGASALMHAARFGHVGPVKLLLERGAAVDARDNEGWTPLMHAAVNGHTDVLRVLLKRGANPDARDRQGRTALLIAASYGDHPAALKALLDGGAERDAKDGKSRTALALAAARGYEESAVHLRERGAQLVTGAASEPARTPRQAVTSALPLVEKSMRIFTERTGCASCHHEGMARMATGFARERGLSIDAALAGTQAQRVHGGFQEMLPLFKKALAEPEEMKHIPGVEIGESTPFLATALAGLAAHRQPADDALAAAAMGLARQQTAEGSWTFNLVRAPSQASRFTMTALAIRAIRAYGPKEHAEESERRIQRAKEWLLSAPVADTEDRALRLLGLTWAGASGEERKQPAADLLAQQRPDGGWAELPTLGSDAYATGQALFALFQNGVPVTDPAYRRGVQFLVRTQDDDGSWFVNKRAIPANNFFDTTFPHGQSQYISHLATSWALMALIPAMDTPAQQAPGQ